MGFIRGGLSFILGILLLFSLIAGNFFLILTLSITPEKIQEGVSENFESIVEFIGTDINLTKEINENFGKIESYCENNSDFVFTEQGYTIDIPCEVALQGEEAIIEEGVKDIVEEVYYEDYSCDSLWRCFLNSENPLFLVSEQAKDYWKSRFYYSLIASLLLIIIMFFLFERKTNLFFVAGFLLIISSLPFMMIKNVFSFFNYSFLQFVPVLFSESYRVFLMSLISGIVVLGFGVGLKFFNFGSFIAEKFSKKEDKEEISKKKKALKKKKDIDEE